jgi:pyruvate dehydrogenase E1 component
MGEAGEAANTSHSQKKMDLESLKVFRDRFHIPLKDDELYDLPYLKPDEDSKVMKYIRQTREGLGGYLPVRNSKSTPLKALPLDAFSSITKGSGDKEMSTTMAFVRLLSTLARDKEIGKNIVPIVPDEARTFGMEGMFRQLGIYSPYGQLYEPEDSDSVMWYKEDKKGQILEEGINEAGAFSSWLAAGTAYSHYGVNMVPFYIFYSMFGFQRIGDLAWLAGDIRAKGFLLGATSGRTTLNGEGLQHEDGHSHIMAGTIPSCVAYDPAFSYELAVIIQDGMKRMYEEEESIFYYITLMNENYIHPTMPEGCEEGIRKGMYLFRKASGKGKKVQLMGSGSIFQEILGAAEILKKEWDVDSDIWSIPGINGLHREGVECERFNMNNPDKKPRIPYVTQSLKNHEGPVVISTDYIRTYPEQIRRLIPNKTFILGTDGYGRSDSRENLRRFFEVDRYYIALNALRGLVDQGDLEPKVLDQAIKKYNLDSNKPNPMNV